MRRDFSRRIRTERRNLEILVALSRTSDRFLIIFRLIAMWNVLVKFILQAPGGTLELSLQSASRAIGR